MIPIHCIATSSQCIPSQKKLSSAIDDTVYFSLCTPATLPQVKARLTAVAAPHVPAWLSVGSILLLMSDRKAVTMWWIGADVNAEDSEYPFCHQHQDKSGHHTTVCNMNGERISRHNTIRDVIYGMASQAAFSPQLEKQYILQCGLQANL